MADLNELYQGVILDHNRSPRNFREIDDTPHHAEGHNPLCGDNLKVWVELDGDVIADASFIGDGCAISKASASLMTQAVKGKSVSQAKGSGGVHSDDINIPRQFEILKPIVQNDSLRIPSVNGHGPGLNSIFAYQDRDSWQTST